MILADRFNYPEEYQKRSLDALETALDTAPLYREWRPCDPGEEAPLDARYDALPELTKQAMRDNFPLGLVPNGRSVEDGLDREEIEYTFTSGTTGDRVVNIWDQNWWNSSEASSWKLNAHTARLDYPQKEAKLASSLNIGISCEEDLPMEYRIMGRKLYLNEKINIIQWQPRHFARMARELGTYKPVVLEANPSLLARLAYWAIDENVSLYSPEVIIFTYEFPSRIHLRAIKKAFSSPLVSSYGTTETGFVMEQCEEGLLHQNIDFCRIDFHPLKDMFGGPELGRILVTTFDNPWNAIVRFDVGDLVRLHRKGSCACGRNTGFIAESIEGRTSNVTFATNGGLVTTMALDNALAPIPGIRDYHLEQNGKSEYELQLMTEPGASGTAAEARSALRQLYGRDGEYEIKLLKNLLPGPAGKFRRTQANFDFDQEGLFV
jgi:phenylacetate-coenzyme A ligase PaaK-like adenylate-forming protein